MPGGARPGSETEGRGQEYIPEARVYYRPGDGEFEREVRARLDAWDEAAGGDDAPDPDTLGGDPQRRESVRNNDRVEG